MADHACTPAKVSVRDQIARGARSIGGAVARLDAELLLAHAIGCSRAQLFAHPDRLLREAEATRFELLLRRRVSGEPLAYITGSREFWSLQIEVDASTLVPRPETELVVELALELLADAPAQVLDLGTGSGAIALALASERRCWRVLATDVSENALALARANALRLGLEHVRFRQSDWYACLGSQRFAMIVANPPYVRDNDPALRGELLHEPLAALASGADGLDALRAVIAGAPAHLDFGGWLICEHGAEQGEAVRALFSGAGFERVRTHTDLAGLDRVSVGRLEGMRGPIP